MKHVLSLILFISFVLTINAQQRLDLDLKKENGHLYFSAQIAGINSEIMLESGIPALLIGRTFYDKYMSDSGLAIEASQSKIRLLNSVYSIDYKATGRISIESFIYDGPIFIVNGYDGISMPIQNIHHPADSSSIIEIDIQRNRFSVMSREKTNESEGKSFPLSFDSQFGFPIISAEIQIETPSGTAELHGNLIVDFGNPLPLFLMKHNENLSKAIQDGILTIHDAYNSKGDVVAQGIYAEKLCICGKIFEKSSIGITDKMQNISQLGFLGIPFFDKPVIFDFDRKLMILK